MKICPVCNNPLPEPTGDGRKDKRLYHAGKCANKANRELSRIRQQATAPVSCPSYGYKPTKRVRNPLKMLRDDYMALKLAGWKACK